MKNATLTITNGDVSVNDIQFPSFLLDYTESLEDYIEMKESLSRVFIEFYHTEEFKEGIESDMFKLLHRSIGDLLDNLHLANVEQKAKEDRKGIEGMLGMSIEEFNKEIKEREKSKK